MNTIAELIELDVARAAYEAWWSALPTTGNPYGITMGTGQLAFLSGANWARQNLARTLPLPVREGAVERAARAFQRVMAEAGGYAPAEGPYGWTPEYVATNVAAMRGAIAPLTPSATEGVGTITVHDDGHPRAEVRDSETGEVIFPAVKGPLTVVSPHQPSEGLQSPESPELTGNSVRDVSRDGGARAEGIAPTMPSREDVARVIAPKNWRNMDEGRTGWKTITHQRRSLQKADTILALFPSTASLDEGGGGWRTIDTAPRDGTVIELAYMVTAALPAKIETKPAGWVQDEEFTHWRPAPPIPRAGDQGVEEG